MTVSDKAVAKAPGAFRTIGEVSEELGVPQHVLRFWETRFPALKPLKRGGNRRYYRPADVVLLKAINKLLYTDGYTIKGVLKLIADKGITGLEAGAAAAAPAAPLAAAALAAEPYAQAPELPLATTATAATPALDISALYAIRDRLAGALAEARAA
ncbi:MerR family transcriptional regulator [Polymorphobacter arshaanensis]|uniref:MerR family transcriptional regulator n=1 Tax=Glacieibacterium arshaanense TaxID=2511025 RepID=A0A4Y9EM02_9SPHN|nr:MerR family transcriptional regulator [Polymorphobacter arshaanensis]TFU03085.1 MerR family transcriptional regulator [Polymorphobacter arshaanensis]